jgi:hypothetical protein
MLVVKEIEVVLATTQIPSPTVEPLPSPATHVSHIYPATKNDVISRRINA